MESDVSDAQCAFVLPEFNADGVLPDGIYSCDEQSLRVRFVLAFSSSKTRAAIHAGFVRLRAKAAAIGVSATQWVNGSFTTSKHDPGDVDVVSFCDYDGLNAMTETQVDALAKLLNGRGTTRMAYWAHTFLVPSCEPGHEFHPVFEQFRAYWRTWFGTTRETPEANGGPPIPGKSKGIIEMVVGDAAKAPKIPRHRPSI